MMAPISIARSSQQNIPPSPSPFPINRSSENPLMALHQRLHHRRRRAQTPINLEGRGTAHVEHSPVPRALANLRREARVREVGPEEAGGERDGPGARPAAGGAVVSVLVGGGEG